MATQTVKENMKITEHNAITNVAIDREMTETENQEFEARQAKVAAAQAEAEAKTAARQVILDRLGLTADEAQLLLGGN